MSESLFILELSSINYDKIKAFCNLGISEGLRIDYKEKFPKNLERLICAFANTVGGIILIGVKADKKMNQPVDIPGIKLIVGLEEKVINMCLSHISPPVVPEVKVCDFKLDQNKLTSDRAVLFIRVRGSGPSAPHYLLNSNEILIRAHNRNSRADLRTIESLIDQREQAIEFEGPMSAYFASKEVEIITEKEAFETVTFVPHFSIETFRFYNKENNDWLFSQMNKVFRLREQEPSRWLLTFVSLNASRQITRWCQISYNGRIDLQRPARIVDNKLDIYTSLEFLAKALKIVKQVYSRFGFYTNFQIGLTILNIENTLLDLGKRRRSDKYACKSNTINISKTVQYDELSQIDQIIKSFFVETCLEFGLVLKEKEISDIVQEILLNVP